MSPYVTDKHGHYTCSEQPIERNYKCNKSCYGDLTYDYKSGHCKSKLWRTRSNQDHKLV